MTIGTGKEVRRHPRLPAFRTSEGTGAIRGDPVAEFRRLGFTPTSGLRTQRHQEALIAQGLTQTRNSSHTRGDGIDLAVPAGMSKQQAIAEVKRRYPSARAIPSNGNAIHVTLPGWGGAPDISGSRRRYGS